MMQEPITNSVEKHHSPIPGWDVFLLALLVLAQVQITSLAESAVLPTRYQDVLRHPWLGGWLPPAGIAAMGEVGPRPGEPIGILLIALTIAGVILYAVVDLLPVRSFKDRSDTSDKSDMPLWKQRTKWAILILIILTAVYLPAFKMILLRQQSGPASYSHDGGVIQTEAAIAYVLDGKNPYTEDYTKTPMAEWGFSQYRTALYHYPYLPWSFLFSLPFYALGQAIGFYDQRLVYLALMTLALLVAPRLVRNQRSKLGLVAALSLNPIMGLDLIFGQNDSFTLCWILFAFVCWQQWKNCPHPNPPPKGEGTVPPLWGEARSGQVGLGRDRWLIAAAFCFGLACASKPTAWFLAPFFAFLLLADQPHLYHSWQGVIRAIPLLLRRSAPAWLSVLLLLLPYAIWDGGSLYDDVWRWSNGQGETGYQIWGWGASNFVLAMGWVHDRFAQWPFLWLEGILALPCLLLFLRRQQQWNTLGAAAWHYGLFLLLFFFGSRFLNENYLGYLFAFLAIGYFCEYDREG